jgi:AcrR family transcriptional regulator
VPDARKPGRSYNSPRRREQAAATREAILDAAQTLFEREGYAGASVAQIAAAAGVSLKTVYLDFETKAGLLRAVWHRVLRGSDDDVPVGGQAWFQEVLDEPDPATQLRMNARNSRVVKQRAGAIMETIRAAAPGDAETATLWARIQADFHANQRAIVESLAAKGALARHLDVETATDILWTLNHPSLHRLLVGERGWTDERYEAWLRGIFCSELLTGPTR